MLYSILAGRFGMRIIRAGLYSGLAFKTAYFVIVQNVYTIDITQDF